MFKNIRIIDSHAHASKTDSVTYLIQSAQTHGFDKFSIMSLSCCGASFLKDNLICALAKLMYPGKIYSYGGLIYPEDPSHTEGYDLLHQTRLLMKLGFDGVKMLEGKPDTRKRTGLPLDSPIYDEFFSYLEAASIPITYHVGDPKIFWDVEKAPDWAKKEGWVYTDGSFVSKETLYDEVNGFLSKFTGLKVTFAHFFFMGEEGIERASDFLDRWPNVNFDLTPGIEMYGSFSQDPSRWREFFIKYQDRIIFGTDNGIDESLVHIDVTRKFLETSDEFKRKDMVIRGIGLHDSILEKIYHGNFERLAGKAPKTINKEMLHEEYTLIVDNLLQDKNAGILIPEVDSIFKKINGV